MYFYVDLENTAKTFMTELYHCLGLYFFDCDIPHRHIDSCTFECPKFIFEKNKEKNTSVFPK